MYTLFLHSLYVTVVQKLLKLTKIWQNYN